MTVAEKQTDLITGLMIIEDVQERLAAVVSRAAKKALSEKDKTQDRLVKGCLSRVWLKAGRQNGRCIFQSDADSPMVKGLVALLCEVYDGGLLEEVVATECRLWEALGFCKLLSPTRMQGLAAVRAKMVADAAG